MITSIVNKPIRRRHQPNTVPSLSLSLLHYFDMWRKKLENYYKETNKKMCRYLTVLKIIKFMFNHKKAGLKEIIAEFKISRRMAIYYMKDLQTIGLVFSKTGRKGYYYIDEDFLLPEKTVQSISEANPPNPPHNDNIYIYNNNKLPHCGKPSLNNNHNHNKTKREGFFLKICSNPNSINQFDSECYKKIIYDTTRGLVYDNLFVMLCRKKFNLPVERIEKHLRRFCNWLFRENMFLTLQLKCFQQVKALFFSFVKKDIHLLQFDENKLKWEERHIRRRRPNSEPTSLGDIINSMFGNLLQSSF